MEAARLADPYAYYVLRLCLKFGPLVRREFELRAHLNQLLCAALNLLQRLHAWRVDYDHFGCMSSGAQSNGTIRLAAAV